MDSDAGSCLTFDECSLFREPNWRYLDAFEIVEKGTSYEVIDSCVRGWIRLLRAIRDGGYTTAQLSAEFPGMYAAYRLETAPHFSELRMEVRGRLLTGQNLERISMKTGLPEQVVRAYQRTFFDVGHGVEYPAYVFGVLEDQVDGQPLTDEQVFLKYCHILGELGLQWMLCTRRKQNESTRAELSQRFRQAINEHPKIRWALESNPYFNQCVQQWVSCDQTDDHQPQTGR